MFTERAGGKRSSPGAGLHAHFEKVPELKLLLRNTGTQDGA